MDINDLYLTITPSAFEEDTTLVTVAGEVDICNFQVLKDALTVAVDVGTKHLVIDLAGVTYIDSSGLMGIIVANTALQKVGGRLSLVGMSERLSRVFTVAGVNHIPGITITNKQEP